MVTQSTECEYCHKVPKDGVRRLGNMDLFEMMKEHNSNYTRRSLFCNACITRMVNKLRARKAAAKRLALSTDEKTNSYSNTTNPVLSDTPSSSGSTTSRRQTRSGNVSSRNVAKRTGGRPSNPDDSSDSSNPSEMEIPVVSTQSDDSNESSQENGSRRNVQPSIVMNIDIDPDGDHGSSFQISPMPRNRQQRTESLNRPPTPERMQNMSASERGQYLRHYNRGTAG